MCATAARTAGPLHAARARPRPNPPRGERRCGRAAGRGGDGRDGGSDGEDAAPPEAGVVVVRARRMRRAASEPRRRAVKAAVCSHQRAPRCPQLVYGRRAHAHAPLGADDSNALDDEEDA